MKANETKIKQYKQGRDFVFDIGEYSITRIVLKPKEYEALKQYFKQVAEKESK